MTCFDGLYLKKLRFACSFLEQNIDISFGPNEALLDALQWSTLRAASRSYQLHLMSHLLNRLNTRDFSASFHPPRVEFSSVDLKKLKLNIIMHFRF